MQATNAHYKVLVFHVRDFGSTGGEVCEDQVYVVESTVTETQVISGDSSGVVCLCLMPSMAERICAALNGTKAACGA